MQEWEDNDYERWNNEDFWKSFKKRDGATCNVNYGGYGSTIGHAPIGIYFGHGLLHNGHKFYVDGPGGIGDMRAYDVCLCFCVDNLVFSAPPGTSMS